MTVAGRASFGAPFLSFPHYPQLSRPAHPLDLSFPPECRRAIFRRLRMHQLDWEPAPGVRCALPAIVSQQASRQVIADAGVK